ncbi:flavin-containing monooxygenase [Aciditerrimonas ferrireducens]|uniref:Flavin-containing monooxygenase n=1 Tax=Aciditerrimonas ferrireducens TaxID=667306 RepID=A0ABV6C2I8_9ACTN|nr:NAD(P)/FAD-dependent oxidoreductase [Aciditerrimonas ferrireducens]
MEELDVLVVGAGLSGIAAGHALLEHCPWADWAIFEARGAIGGTWDLFRYPGVRSDSDMFTLGFTFHPWDRERAIAEGADIRAYLQETARRFGIDRRIRFHHRVLAAEWSTETARWQVQAERTDTGEPVELTCRFLLGCSGYYRYDQGYLPAFPGMAEYRGQLVHPQFWPEDLPVAGRRICVIGSGATAMTLVPALAERGAQVTMVQRSPTYVTSLPAVDPVAAALRRRFPTRLSAPLVRWYKALTTQGFYRLSRRWPGLVRRMLLEQVRRQLPEGYDVARHFTPRYDPWDQRLCVVPNGDLFAAIRSGRVEVVTDEIETFTPEGLRLRSGRELEADVVVTATGLELLFLGGIELRVDGESVDPATRLTYKGMMLEGVPNLAFCIGYVNASWTLKCELTCEAVCRILRTMREKGATCVTPVHDGDPGPARPLLDLTSGYVQRALDRMPRQGSRFPWQVHQSFLKDYRAMKLSPVEDGVLRFSAPDRERAEAPLVGASSASGGVRAAS